MGCWNGTCFLTNLPILHHDPIVLIPTTSTRGHREGHAGFSYPEDMYVPVSLPVYGEYDDYGGIENMDKYPENHLDTVFSQLKRVIRVNRLKYLKYEKPPEEVQFTDLATLLERIEREKIERLGFVMAHRSAYESLAGYTGATQWVHVGDEVHTKPIQEYAGVSLDKVVERFKSYDEDDYKRIVEMESSDFANYFSYHYPSFRNLVELYVQAGEPEPLKKLIVDFIVFKYAIGEGRYSWMPNSGKGSQDTSTDVQVMIAEQTLKIAHEIKHRWDEDEEWNEDDEDA